MGISHIDDLKSQQFADMIRHIGEFAITEKIDGSQLFFGIDGAGQLFTSREGKGETMVAYSVNDYPHTPATNGFRAAHAALKANEEHFRCVLTPSDLIEIEVLYGRQPNTIVYGSNRVVFLRNTTGNHQAIQLLQNTPSVTTKSTKITSVDGTNLQKTEKLHRWLFSAVPTIDNDINCSDISLLLQWYDDYNTNIPDNTNMEVLNAKLTHTKHNDRAALKEARAQASTIEQNYKNDIKQYLIDTLLRTRTPKFRDVTVLPCEDIGIEGVVIRHPDTLQQYKVVDKQSFTAINMFNYGVRNQLFRSSMFPLNTTSATIDRDISIYDQMLHDVNSAIGVESLGTHFTLKRNLKRANILSIQELIARTQPTEMTRLCVIEILHNTLNTIKIERSKYFKRYGDFAFDVRGNTVQYTHETHSRTLVGFAELIIKVNMLLDTATDSPQPDSIITAIYNRYL